MALVFQESTFNPNAKNKKSTATGLTQVLAATRKDVETKMLKIPTKNQSALYDPNYSILIGMTYLGWLWNRPFVKESTKRMIVSYHDGHYKENSAGQNYYVRIKRHYDDLLFNAQQAEAIFYSATEELIRRLTKNYIRSEWT